MKKIICMIFFLLNISTFAHPHVFYEAFFRLNIQNDTVKDMDVTLYLDELNSAVFSAKLEENPILSEEDLDFFKDIARDVHLEIDSKDIESKIEFKSATLDEESVKIEFILHIDKKIKDMKNMVFSIYDSEYFYTYDYDKSSMLIDLKESNYSAKYKLKENLKKPFYFGMVYPNEYEVSFY